MAQVDVFEAISAGDEDALKDILEQRPDAAGRRNADGLSAVRHALYVGHGELVQPLLDANPPLDVFDAAAVGRNRGLTELLDSDEEAARSWSPDGFTPLHLAAYFGQADAVRLLLEHGADVGARSRNELGVAPLNSAAAGPVEGARVEVARLLLDAGADPNSELESGFRPLDAALQNGDEELAQLLRERGATRGSAPRGA
jgi:ankyrin repeat protein